MRFFFLTFLLSVIFSSCSAQEYRHDDDNKHITNDEEAMLRSVINPNDTIQIVHKHKQVYQRFNDEPEYGLINVDIDWPVSYKGADLAQLQQQLIDVAFDRKSKNIDAMMNSFCAPRSSGRIVTTIPTKIKQDGYPLYKDELEIKCTQAAGRYATFKIENWTQSSLHSNPGYRRYVTYDFANQKVLEEKDVFSKNEYEYYEYKDVVFEYLYDTLKGDINVISSDGEIASFYFTDDYTVFLFDEEVNGFKEVKVPHNEIGEYMTDNGRCLIGVKGGSTKSQWLSCFDLPTHTEGIKWQLKGEGSFIEIKKDNYPSQKIKVCYLDRDYDIVFFGDANFDGHVDAFIITAIGARPSVNVFFWDDISHKFIANEDLEDNMFFICNKKKALKSLGLGSAWEYSETLYVPSGNELKKMGSMMTCNASGFVQERMNNNGGYVYQVFDENGKLVKKCNLRSQLPDEWR